MKSSLIIFEKAAVMLAEADTIQKAKELKSMALTAKDWAVRKKMGADAIQHCRSYAFEAERKMGEMLRDTERAKGGWPSCGGTTLPQDETKQPTLTELGLTKRESAEAQMLADIPPDEFEKVKAGKKTKAKIKKERKAATDRANMEKAAGEAPADLMESCDVRLCSCQDLFKSGIKPDAVITDPPYPKEFLSVFSELAEAAKQVPLVAVMVGQTYLPEVLDRLKEHLEYRWTIAYLTPGGQAVQQFPRKINTFWKPVLLFGKSTEWLGDVTKSSVNDNDKDHHHWGQSESGLADLVTRLTKPGQLVCDPFVGGGTTAVVSLALHRKFVGCDIDQKSVNETITRVKSL